MSRRRPAPGERGGFEISRRFLTVVLAMLASCVILVGLSWYLLNLLSGMVRFPNTPVEVSGEVGELLIPLEEEAISMQASLDGRYLAVVTRYEEKGNILQVLDLESGEAVWKKEIDGQRASWLGSQRILIFEDGGDIFSLDVEGNELWPANLTRSGDRDIDPLPSPDGEHILWTRLPSVGGEAEFWVMEADGEGLRSVGNRKDLATWSPDGKSLISVERRYSSGGEGEGGTYLQRTGLDGEGWRHYADCSRWVGFLWWPEQEEVLYVAPYRVGEETRAVWFRVNPGGKDEKEASTEGLARDTSLYLFYPERRGSRLAYWGERGLEIYDRRKGIIKRYPELERTGLPLAWREERDEILWQGPGGVYRLGLDRDTLGVR